jgi:hypothetical protein
VFLPAFGARLRIAGLMLAACFCAFAPAQAETPSNANSPMGTNLSQVTYYTTELPFLDNFKASGSWTTFSGYNNRTGESQYLNLDANGWPVSLTAVNEPVAQQFTYVGVFLLNAEGANSPVSVPYPAGQYVVRYQGQGTLTYGGDAVKNVALSAPGRDVVDVKTPGNGVYIYITSTDPNKNGNYIRNIQFVYAPYETALLQGQVFNPAFLALMQNFRVLRFMDWFNTNGSTLASWADRPLPTDSRYTGTFGVPYEVAIQLANALSADPWLTIPVMADDNFITQFATLAHSQVGTSQKVYVELSNEVWNSGFPQYAYSNAQGQAMWPAASTSADLGDNWYGMRAAQMCDIWKSAWGSDSGRVVCVMAAFVNSGGGYTAKMRLSCPLWTGAGNAPCAAHGFGAVAIAPYFGGTVPLSWTSQSDGGLASFFTSLTSQNDPSVPVGGYIGHVMANVAANVTAIAPYKLPLIAYEGGQGFVDMSKGPLMTLYFAANRDPRMQTAYTTYLQAWKNAGGTLFVHFNDMDEYGWFGEWGSLESIMQTTSPLSSAPPKWQALQNFISGNPCWWTGCTGTIAQIPAPPTSVSVK